MLRTFLEIGPRLFIACLFQAVSLTMSVCVHRVHWVVGLYSCLSFALVTNNTFLSCRDLWSLHTVFLLFSTFVFHVLSFFFLFYFHWSVLPWSVLCETNVKTDGVSGQGWLFKAYFSLEAASVQFEVSHRVLWRWGIGGLGMSVSIRGGAWWLCLLCHLPCHLSATTAALL